MRSIQRFVAAIVGSIVLGGALVAAGPALAVPIPGLGEIDPAYFKPKNQLGLASTTAPDRVIDPSVPQIRVCNPGAPGCVNPDISVTQTLGTIWQRPQNLALDPTPAFPYVADVTFTFTRLTPPPITPCPTVGVASAENGCGSPNPVLVAFVAVVDPYATDPPTGLDRSTLAGAAPLPILQRLTAGTDLQFPSYLLPGLVVGASHQMVARYVVGGVMQPNVLGGFDLPPIALTGFEVPEPGTALLIGVGLASVGCAAKRRGARRGGR